jgi:hypothetical protein
LIVEAKDIADICLSTHFLKTAAISRHTRNGSFFSTFFRVSGSLPEEKL